MKATLSNYRQSPRKVRLLVDLVRGKSVESAITELSHASKRAAMPLKKLLESAVANALSAGAKREELFIEHFTVDKGVVLKRYRPGARGRSYPYHKHTSQVRVSLNNKPSLEKPRGKNYDA